MTSIESASGLHKFLSLPSYKLPIYAFYGTKSEWNTAIIKETEKDTDKVADSTQAPVASSTDHKHHHKHEHSDHKHTASATKTTTSTPSTSTTTTKSDTDPDDSLGSSPFYTNLYTDRTLPTPWLGVAPDGIHSPHPDEIMWLCALTDTDIDINKHGKTIQEFVAAYKEKRIHTHYKYTHKICAAFKCKEINELVPSSSHHLCLCKSHLHVLAEMIAKELSPSLRDESLTKFLESLTIHELHDYTYEIILPGINSLLDLYTKHLHHDQQIHPAHQQQYLLLLSFKASLYLYRQHLNPMSILLIRLIELFMTGLDPAHLGHLDPSTTTGHLSTVSTILNYVKDLFATVGILITFIVPSVVTEHQHWYDKILHGTKAPQEYCLETVIVLREWREQTVGMLFQHA